MRLTIRSVNIDRFIMENMVVEAQEGAATYLKTIKKNRLKPDHKEKNSK